MLTSRNWHISSEVTQQCLYHVRCHGTIYALPYMTHHSARSNCVISISSFFKIFLFINTFLSRLFPVIINCIFSTFFPQKINYSNNRSPKACEIWWVLLTFPKLHIVLKIFYIWQTLFLFTVSLSRPSKLTLIYCFYLQHHVFDITLTDNFQYQSQIVDTENTTPWDQRTNVQITDNSNYCQNKPNLQNQ